METGASILHWAGGEVRAGVLILSQTHVTRIMTSMKKDVVSIMTCYPPNDAWTRYTACQYQSVEAVQLRRWSAVNVSVSQFSLPIITHGELYVHCFVEENKKAFWILNNVASRLPPLNYPRRL